MKKYRWLLFIIFFLGISLDILSQSLDSLNKFDLDGKKTGFWITEVEDVQLYEDTRKIDLVFHGNFKNGLPEGIWIGYFKNTNLPYSYEFYRNGKVDSFRLEFSEYGKLLEQNWIDNDNEIFLTIEYDYYGRQVNVNYRDTNIHSNTEIGQPYNTPYKYWFRNKKTGFYCLEEMVLGEMKLIKEEINGKCIGYHTEYYLNGFIKYRYYCKNGLIEGTYLGFYDNGILKVKENYVNNKKEGKQIYYNQDGSIKEIRFYKGGVEIVD